MLESLFNRVSSKVGDLVGGKVTQVIGKTVGSKTNTFTFQALPKTLEELKALPEAALTDVYAVAALSLLALTRFAELIGLAFQIEDDILDVTSTAEELGKPIGSDEKNNKSTYVSLFGLETARKMADDTTKEALACLDSFGEKAEALREIAKLMTNRRN